MSRVFVVWRLDIYSISLTWLVFLILIILSHFINELANSKKIINVNRSVIYEINAFIQTKSVASLNYCRFRHVVKEALNFSRLNFKVQREVTTLASLTTNQVTLDHRGKPV